MTMRRKAGTYILPDIYWFRLIPSDMDIYCGPRGASPYRRSAITAARAQAVAGHAKLTSLPVEIGRRIGLKDLTLFLN